MDDINNYGDLKRAVRIWLNRKDSSTLDNIPMFINMAHKAFTRLVKLPYYEVLVHKEVGEGEDYVTIPEDFLSAKHLSVNGVPYNRVDTETFMRIKNSNTQVTGIKEPRSVITTPAFLQGATTEKDFFFTRVGGNILFIPELSTGDSVEMIYQQDIPELKKDSDEPYSLLVASDVMLYLSLQHAAKFLRDAEGVAYWESEAIKAAQSLQEQLDEAEWSGSALVVPQFSR